jgi:putative transposase
MSEKVLGTMSIKAYKYRISCNKATTEKLYGVLTLCRQLYNAALQERRDAYEMLVERHPYYYDWEQSRYICTGIPLQRKSF